MPNTSTVARAGENVRNYERNRRIADHHMNSRGQDHFIRDFRSEIGKTQVQWEFKNPCRQFRSPGIEVPHAVRAGMPF
ncbi:PhzA/PhzB family protein [Streptomyces niveus]|uniref:PhzA/PhzB family protein n=1 Tax=Streptomyces niveus TaxID=193462 RepID=UPI0035D7186F